MKKALAVSCFAAVILAGCGIDQPAEQIVKPEPVTMPETTQAETTTTTTATTTTTTAATTTTTSAKSATTTTDKSTATTNTALTSTTDVGKTTTTAVSTENGNASAGGRPEMYAPIYSAEIQRVWDDISKKNDGIVSIDYATYDMDLNGIPELLLKYGTCEADYRIAVYTIDENGKLLLSGETGGSHASFARDDYTDEFVITSGHMNSGSFMWFELKEGVLKQTHSETVDYKDVEEFDKKMFDENIWYLDYVHAYCFGEDYAPISYIMYAYSEYVKVDGLYLGML